MAPASSATLAGTPGAIAISDMAAIAAQISSTRTPGTRALAPLVALSGRARRATTTRMTAIAVTAKKAPRQSP